jgi:ribose transport system substrate-binding protein
MLVNGLIRRYGFACVFMAALGGCATHQHAASEKFYLVATNIKLPYWQTALAGFSRAGAQLGVPVEMVGPDTYDPNEEDKQFRQLLDRKPTGILVSAADPSLLGPDIDAALARGIPVLTMDSDATQSKRPFFIGTDNYKAGMMGGQLTAKLMNGKGNVVFLGMPAQLNLAQRLHGYRDAFASFPHINVLNVIDIKGDAPTAFDATKEALSGKTNVDAFVCLEAIACPEVAEVVNRRNLGGKVVIVAMDTDERTLDWIQKGVIAATVGQKPYTMAFHGLVMLDAMHHYPAPRLAADWTQDSFSPYPSFIDTGAMLITRQNVNAFLRARPVPGSAGSAQGM